LAYYLDTNICIYYLKGLYPTLPEKLFTYQVSEIKIASIVKAELLFGAARSKKRKANKEQVEQFLLPFEVVTFDDQSAQIYAHIRSVLAAKGMPIGPNDLVLASTVLARKGVLITNNENEFNRVPGLQIENWI
jgi:tRNA(fMet)-specific endonuclease VapC